MIGFVKLKCALPVKVSLSSSSFSPAVLPLSTFSCCCTCSVPGDTLADWSVVAVVDRRADPVVLLVGSGVLSAKTI